MFLLEVKGCELHTTPSLKPQTLSLVPLRETLNHRPYKPCGHKELELQLCSAAAPRWKQFRPFDDQGDTYTAKLDLGSCSGILFSFT